MPSKRNTPTALVTGAATRIGKAICLKLASMGFNIILHYHTSKSKALATVKLIRDFEVNCDLSCCNLSDEKETVAWVNSLRKSFPRLNTIINNASVFNTSTIEAQNLKDLNTQININFKAPYILISQFAKKYSKGNIINLLDTHIVNSQTMHTNYLLSKKALLELTKLSAVELAPRIRVNAIAPGLILPPTGKKPNYLNRLAQNIPLKKKGSVDHITHAVDFLINNSYITGQTIYVDGGEHLL